MMTSCCRCGVSVPAEWAFHEEAGATECPRCWHRLEEKELRDEVKRLRAELVKANRWVSDMAEQFLSSFGEP